MCCVRLLDLHGMSTEASLKHLKPDLKISRQRLQYVAIVFFFFFSLWKRIHYMCEARTGDGERSNLRTRLQRWQFTWRFLSVHPEKE